MNKEIFMWILECALLSYDGVPYEELIKIGAMPKEAQSGIMLSKYLKSVNLPEEKAQEQTTK